MTTPDPLWLDRMYNNRALVPEHGAFLSAWAEDSARVRATQPCHLNLPYGDGPQATLDVFAPAQPVPGGAPVLVFLHGGYWRSLDKADHSFVAPSFTQAGVCVVVPNYALCPGAPEGAVTIPFITAQMVQALAWVARHVAHYGGDPARITVAGHSAGGQLAAMMLVTDWAAHGADLPAGLVRRGLSISGLYDLEPLRHTPCLQPALLLTPEQVQAASPIHQAVPPQARLFSVVGGAESAEFLRQNRLIREAWGPAAVPVCEELPGLHHFSVLSALAQPGHRLHQLARELVWAP